MAAPFLALVNPKFSSTIEREIPMNYNFKTVLQLQFIACGGTEMAVFRNDYKDAATIYKIIHTVCSKLLIVKYKSSPQNWIILVFQFIDMYRIEVNLVEVVSSSIEKKPQAYYPLLSNTKSIVRKMIVPIVG